VASAALVEGKKLAKAARKKGGGSSTKKLEPTRRVLGVSGKENLSFQITDETSKDFFAVKPRRFLPNISVEIRFSNRRAFSSAGLFEAKKKALKGTKRGRNLPRHKMTCPRALDFEKDQALQFGTEYGWRGPRDARNNLRTPQN